MNNHTKMTMEDEPEVFAAGHLPASQFNDSTKVVDYNESLKEINKELKEMSLTLTQSKVSSLESTTSSSGQLDLTSKSQLEVSCGGGELSSSAIAREARAVAAAFAISQVH